MPLAGGLTSSRNANLTCQLERWNQKENLGITFGSCTGFTLPNGAVRSPNASWLKRNRWDALTQEQKETFAPVCPDFVAELRSDTNCLKRLQNKMLEYLANGTQLGWLIDRKSQQVEIYRANTEVEIIAPMALSGEAVLPGFILNLEPIW